MTDVLLFNGADGGDISYVNGLAQLDDGLGTAVYLSLFGGNEQDSGLPADARRQWWGNLGESDPARTYRSETQHLLRSIAAITANIRRIEDAVERDLAWMVGDIATVVSAQVTLPALNTARIAVNIEVNSAVYAFDFVKRWGAPA